MADSQLNPHAHDLHTVYRGKLNRHFLIPAVLAVAAGAVYKIYINGNIKRRDDYYQQLEATKQRLRSEAEARANS